MRTLLVITGWMLTVVSVQAQQGQVVQLPSISTFSYSGSVVVPDGGTAFLGGNRASSSGVTRNGGLGNQLGSSQSVSQASVKATIIDLDEMDRAILGGTPQQFMQSRRGAQVNRKADPDRDGKAIVRYARMQYQKGNRSASFRGYQTAIAMLSPRLSDLAATEFRRVFGSAADQALRMSSLRR
tara:strand:+ start:15725 stop:16273 length:549 start_codon:yes stop_codon:yes gene_type:complete